AAGRGEGDAGGTPPPGLAARPPPPPGAPPAPPARAPRAPAAARASAATRASAAARASAAPAPTGTAGRPQPPQHELHGVLHPWASVARIGAHAVARRVFAAAHVLILKGFAAAAVEVGHRILAQVLVIEADGMADLLGRHLAVGGRAAEHLLEDPDDAIFDG